MRDDTYRVGQTVALTTSPRVPRKVTRRDASNPYGVRYWTEGDPTPWRPSQLIEYREPVGEGK